MLLVEPVSRNTCIILESSETGEEVHQIYSVYSVQCKKPPSASYEADAAACFFSQIMNLMHDYTYFGLLKASSNNPVADNPASPPAHSRSVIDSSVNG